MATVPAYVVYGWLAANGHSQLNDHTLRLLLADESLKPFYWTPSDYLQPEEDLNLWGNEDDI